MTNHTQQTLNKLAVFAIYLCSLPIQQGGHKVLNLATGQTITLCKSAILPIPESVINIIEKWINNKE